jgi:O-acetyl-ADP-ribose deacetylase (regulator of RNase III)
MCRMNIQIVEGDILQSKEQYIVQQCNCISVKAHGLSKTISVRFPHADSYARRIPMGSKNLATVESRSDPGSIVVCGNGLDERYVINAFGQYGMGKPYTLNNVGRQWIDGSEDRFKWFKSCLESISRLKPQSVAFPWMIGCGLAGGCWDDYYSAIKVWSTLNPLIGVVLYKLQ